MFGLRSILLSLFAGLLAIGAGVGIFTAASAGSTLDGDFSVVIRWIIFLNLVAWVSWVMPSFCIFSTFSSIRFSLRVLGQVVVALLILNVLFFGIVFSVWFVPAIVLIEVVLIELVREFLCRDRGNKESCK